MQILDEERALIILTIQPIGMEVELEAHYQIASRYRPADRNNPEEAEEIEVTSLSHHTASRDFTADFLDEILEANSLCFAQEIAEKRREGGWHRHISPWRAYA